MCGDEIRPRELRMIICRPINRWQSSFNSKYWPSDTHSPCNEMQQVCRNYQLRHFISGFPSFYCVYNCTLHLSSFKRSEYKSKEKRLTMNQLRLELNRIKKKNNDEYDQQRMLLYIMYRYAIWSYARLSKKYYHKEQWSEKN